MNVTTTNGITLRFSSQKDKYTNSKIGLIIRLPSGKIQAKSADDVYVTSSTSGDIKTISTDLTLTYGAYGQYLFTFMVEDENGNYTNITSIPVLYSENKTIFGG